jgi:hypothetical protein|tara:strand:+ start:528 stop:743 length:216 start_codon:yes stop_codon:yes gene_type:complete
MGKNNDIKTKAKDIVDNADEGCKNCENFGQSSCPSFQKAVNDDGADSESLSDAIKEEQKGRSLIPCKNVPS